MRLVTAALFIAGTMLVAAPASAEDVYVGSRAGGVGVGVDVGGPHFRDRDRVVTERREYRDDFARARCRTVIIHEGNVTRKIRKCHD